MSITPTQYAQNLRDKVEQLRTKNLPFAISVQTIVGEAGKRIFVSGTNDVGNTFKYNDSTPMYVPNPSNPKSKTAWIEARQKSVMTGKGKYGSSKFKDGSPHVTTYFESYKEFRSVQGLESNYVNWQYNNDLQSDYLNSPKGNITGAKAEQVNANEYQQVVRNENVQKYAGLSKRYGDFLQLSSKEITRFYDLNEKELANYLSK